MSEDWVRRALARKTKRRGARGSYEVQVVEADERLVFGVKFAIAMIVCLSAVEVAHLAFLGSWSSEVFASLTGLSGTVLGIFVGHKT